MLRAILMTFRNILFSSKGPLHSEWIEAIAPALGSCRLLFSFKRFKKKSAICEDKVKKTVIFKTIVFGEPLLV